MALARLSSSIVRAMQARLVKVKDQIAALQLELQALEANQLAAARMLAADDDITRTVLEQCDVRSLVATMRTCSRLREIGFSALRAKLCGGAQGPALQAIERLLPQRLGFPAVGVPAVGQAAVAPPRLIDEHASCTRRCTFLHREVCCLRQTLHGSSSKTGVWPWGWSLKDGMAAPG